MDDDGGKEEKSRKNEDRPVRIKSEGNRKA